MAVRFWAPTVLQYIKKSLKTIKCSHLGVYYFVNSEKSEAKVPCLCITDVEGSLHHRGGKGKKEKEKRKMPFVSSFHALAFSWLVIATKRNCFSTLDPIFLSLFLSFFLFVSHCLTYSSSIPLFIPSMSFLQKQTHIVSMIYRELYVFL